MKTQSTFTGWNFTAVTGIWAIESGAVFSYPYLRENAQSPAPGHEVVALTGSGTALDPYQITNLQALRYLSEHSIIWSASFIQTADIDASATSGWNGGAGFSPIGNSTITFTGKYNGQNQVIENLFQSKPTDYGGLFGNVSGSGSRIENLGLTNINIPSNGKYTGGLVGYLNRGTIENCYVTGALNTTSGYLGGLVGYDYVGTISNCYFNGTVGSVSSSYYIGGLVGYLYYGSVANCNAKGSVTSTSSYTGGLIGYVDEYADISDSHSNVVVSVVAEKNSAGGLIGGSYYFEGSIDGCYSLGSVTGTGDNIGGFIGEGYGNYGHITNCYSMTNVNGGKRAGGFFGYSYYLITENCYSAGAVTGTSGYTGGFTGYDDGGNDIINCFWDTESSGQATSDGNLGTPKTTLEMKTQSTFTGWHFTTIWAIKNGSMTSYPYIIVNAQSPAPGEDMTWTGAESTN